VEPGADRGGVALVGGALSSRRFGPYSLQAAIGGRACPGAERGGDRLGADRRTLDALARAMSAP